MPIAEASLAAQAAARLTAIDPLLPTAVERDSGCGALFTATDQAGWLSATARCQHWAGKPGAYDLVWGALHRFTLVPQLAGPDVPGALGQLMTQWHDHLADVPEAAGDDTAALVNWPSRDIDGVATLLAHGLTPQEVLAIRPASHRRTGESQLRQAGLDAGVRIRRAEPQDIDVVTEFGWEEIKFDAHFGGVIARPEAMAGLRDYLAVELAEPEPWTWLAERDGSTVGMLTAERPSRATWLASHTQLSPVAYLSLAFVLSTERSNGIGKLLTQQFHQITATPEIYGTLLHYATFNPLSVPFWSQQGYRPLWTVFGAWPARSLHRTAIR